MTKVYKIGDKEIEKLIKTYMFIQKQGEPLKNYFTKFLKSVEDAKLVKVIKTKHL